MCSARFVFPRRTRVRTAADYQAVFNEGIRVSSVYFRAQLALLPATNRPFPRLGLAVSKKVDKNAHGRNRIKRLCREVFRHRQTSLAAADYVLIARPEAADADNAQLRGDLEKCLDRAQTLLERVQLGTMHGSEHTPPVAAPPPLPL